MGPTDVAVSPDGRNVYVAAGDSGALSTFRRDAQTGALAQLACVSNNGTDGRDGTDGACADGDALRGASSVAVSPDGKFVYVTSYYSNGVAILSRDDAGRLTQVGCVRAVSTCTPAPFLIGASDIAISPDGTSAYVAAYDADTVVSFSRDPATGLLKTLGCVSDDGSDRLCTKGNALRGPIAVTVSKDGRFVYVAAEESDSVLTFTRDPATGAITQTGCLMDDAPKGGSCTGVTTLASPVALELSADGDLLWAAASDSGAIVALARDRTTGLLRKVGCVSEQTDEPQDDGCAHVPTLSGPTGITVTPDGRRVIVGINSGLAVFDRVQATGGLAYAGCLTDADYYDEDVVKGCTLAHGVADAVAVAVSPDSRNVYSVSSSYEHDSVTAFGPAVSVAAARMNSRHTLSVRLSCPRLRAALCAGVVTVRSASPSTLTVSRKYVVRPGRSKVVRLRLAAALLERSLRSLRPGLIVAARDGGSPLRPSVRRLPLQP